MGVIGKWFCWNWSGGSKLTPRPKFLATTGGRSHPVGGITPEPPGKSNTDDSDVECFTQEDSLSGDQYSEAIDSQDRSPAFSVRDRCWLCQSARNDDDQLDSDDGITF